MGLIPNPAELAPPPPPPAPVPAQSSSRAAVWTLILLAPFFGELISGSTPLLLFLTPLGWIAYAFDIALYGLGALLCRELAQRWGGGYLRVWVLGLAYGVLEEGVVLQTWFNRYWPDVQPLHDFSRVAGLNVLWAVTLTIYHATFSILIPIVVTETMFGDKRTRHWLNRAGLRRVQWGLAATAVFGFAVILLLFAHLGYSHPPGSYLIALLTLTALVLTAKRLHHLAPPTMALPHSPWFLAAGAFIVSVLFFVTGWGGSSIFPHAPLLPVILVLAFAAVSLHLIHRNSRSSSFNRRHMLALCSGPTSALLLLNVIHNPTELPVAAATITGAVWLFRRTRAG